MTKKVPFITLAQAKEIAADLEEESNPVIMIARYKNE